MTPSFSYARSRRISSLLRKSHRSCPPARLQVELLEDRLAPALFTVLNTSDSGAGSLRQAILDANSTAGADTINFSIPGAGVQTISPASALPAITEGVFLNGYSQPGSSANTLQLSDNAVLLIELNGTSAGAGTIGLNIMAPSCDVAGFVINSFSGVGIQLTGSGTTQVNVQGNFIGTNPAGTVAEANAGGGILITGGAHDNTIGGAADSSRNLISGNTDGIRIGGSGNTVQNNFIGTDKTRTQNLGNQGDGVLLNLNGKNNIIGSVNPSAGNTIAFNNVGIHLTDTASGDGLLSNVIFSNTGLGIQLDAGTNNGQTPPVLTSAITDGATTVIAGTVHSTPNSVIFLQFFLNSVADASGAGEGQTVFGSTTVGTNAAGDASFSFRVSGSNTLGQFISATASDLTSNTSAFAVDVTVKGAFTLVPGSVSVSATEGVTFTKQLAAFTTDDTSLTASNFTATIDWGDGTSTPGMISGSNGSFMVTGTHTYAEEGSSFNLIVTVRDTRNNFTRMGMGMATVADAALTAGAFTPPAAVEGIPLNRVLVFHFTDANPAAKASDFTATLMLGDGSMISVTSTASAAGQIVARAGGGFDVLLSHTYTGELTNQTFSVQVNDVGGASTSASSETFSVTDAPLTAIGKSITVTAGSTFTGVVATFTDAGGAKSDVNYNASINWGDGTPATPGTISVSGETISVTGTHTFAATGTFAGSVAIKDVGGSQTSANFSASVASRGTNASFVAAAYRDLLHREQDPDGAAFWVGLLNQGTSRMVVALGFESSLEFRTNLVQSLYQTFLGRPADDFGLNASIAFLASGGTIEQVEAAIIGSPEYFQKRGGNTNDGFLTALYKDVLGRDVDPGARMAFDQALAANVSRIALAQFILTSVEAEQRLVDSFFLAHLGRHADPSGLATFTDALQHGARDEAVIATLVGSAEFFDRL